MELTKIPGPMRIIWGSIGAWWVGQLLNPGFFSVAILMACLIPIVIFELYFYEPKKVSLNLPAQPNDKPEAEQTYSPLQPGATEDTA
jgi:hypothetical protein